MLYELKRGRVGFIMFEELEDDYVMYGFPKSTINDCCDNPYNFRSNAYVSGELVFAVLDIINLQNVFGDKNRLALYIQNELVLIVSVNDHDESIKKAFDMAVSFYEDRRGLREALPEKFLCHFLDKLIADDRKFLENMEHNMSLLESNIMKAEPDTEFINEIIYIKKELMFIWNYYDQMIDFGEILRDNETDMFPPENLKGFDAFTKRVIRMSDNVKQLKEYAVQLQEIHDAMLSYNLNNIMKIFTVVTAVFLPLSLIVGWYGMNFEYMPELSWKYGYVGVVILSVLVVCFCLLFFRRRRLL